MYLNKPTCRPETRLSWLHIRLVVSSSNLEILLLFVLSVHQFYMCIFRSFALCLSCNLNSTFKGPRGPFWASRCEMEGLRLLFDMFNMTISQIIPCIICLILTISCIFVKCFITGFELSLILSTQTHTIYI